MATLRSTEYHHLTDNLQPQHEATQDEAQEPDEEFVCVLRQCDSEFNGCLKLYDTTFTDIFNERLQERFGAMTEDTDVDFERIFASVLLSVVEEIRTVYLGSLFGMFSGACVFKELITDLEKNLSCTYGLDTLFQVSPEDDFESREGQ